MNASSSTLDNAERSEPRFVSIADIQKQNPEELQALTERKRKLRKIVISVMGTAVVLLGVAGVRAAFRTSDESVAPNIAAVRPPTPPPVEKLASAPAAIPAPETTTTATATASAAPSAAPRSTRLVSAATRSKALAKPKTAKSVKRTPLRK